MTRGEVRLMVEITKRFMYEHRVLTLNNDRQSLKHENCHIINCSQVQMGPTSPSLESDYHYYRNHYRYQLQGHH